MCYYLDSGERFNVVLDVDVSFHGVTGVREGFPKDEQFCFYSSLSGQPGYCILLCVSNLKEKKKIQVQ